MFRGILTTLAAAAVVTGLTSNAYAKPMVRSQPETSFVTRSGQSLSGIHSRNLAKDYPTRFSDSPNPNNINNKVIAQVRTPSTSKKLPFGLGTFGNKVRVDSGVNASGSGKYPNPLRLREANDDVDSHVSVKYQLQEY